MQKNHNASLTALALYKEIGLRKDAQKDTIF